eukprot:Colp12_sorted_trinity150504_noHs@13956
MEMEVQRQSSVEDGLERRSSVDSTDDSLQALMRFLTLEYKSEKKIQPIWKKFTRGKHHKEIDSAAKKRLDNVIWRAWFEYYKRGRRNPFFSFLVDVELVETDPRTGAGSQTKEYWKRRCEAVALEYTLWRKWHKQQLLRREAREKEGDGHDDLVDQIAFQDAVTSDFLQFEDQDLFAAFGFQNMESLQSTLSSSENINSIADTLFTSLDTPIGTNLMVHPEDSSNMLSYDVRQPSLSTLVQPKTAAERKTNKTVWNKSGQPMRNPQEAVSRRSQKRRTASHCVEAQEQPAEPAKPRPPLVPSRSNPSIPTQAVAQPTPQAPTKGKGKGAAPTRSSSH